MKKGIALFLLCLSFFFSSVSASDHRGYTEEDITFIHNVVGIYYDGLSKDDKVVHLAPCNLIDAIAKIGEGDRSDRGEIRKLIQDIEKKRESLGDTKEKNTILTSIEETKKKVYTHVNAKILRDYGDSVVASDSQQSARKTEENHDSLRRTSMARAENNREEGTIPPQKNECFQKEGLPVNLSEGDSLRTLSPLIKKALKMLEQRTAHLSAANGNPGYVLKLFQDVYHTGNNQKNIDLKGQNPIGSVSPLIKNKREEKDKKDLSPVMSRHAFPSASAPSIKANNDDPFYFEL